MGIFIMDIDNNIIYDNIIDNNKKIIDNCIWVNGSYYLKYNGENNINKECIMLISIDDVYILLNAIKELMKFSLWDNIEKNKQLYDDMNYWHYYKCRNGDNCKNKYKNLCGYYHPCDDNIKPMIKLHYMNYPSYIPNGRKMKIYNPNFNKNGEIDQTLFAENEKDLRILPYNHRKIFTWLHIRVITHFRKTYKMFKL